MLFPNQWISYCIFVLLLVMSSFQGVLGQEAQKIPVQAVLVWGQQEIEAGKPVQVVLHLKIQDGWHIYWKNPGRMGLPVEMQWQLPEGWQLAQVDWSRPQFVHTEESGSDPVLFGYEKEAFFLVTFYLPHSWPPHSWTGREKPELQVQIHWLACSETSCWPGVSTADISHSLAEHPKTLFDQAQQQIPSRHIVSLADQARGRLTLPFPLQEGQSVVKAEFFPNEGENGRTMDTPDVSLEDHSIAFLPTQEGVLTLQLLDKQEERIHSLALSLQSTPVPSEVSEILPSPPSQVEDTVFSGGLLLALLLAFCGGVLLNGMPCVLPILSIKLIGFIEMAKDGMQERCRHAFFFTLGVLVSFWGLAAVLLSLRAYGEQVGWGFQLQEPLFVALFTCFLFLMGLNLLGVFEWGSGIAGWVGEHSPIGKRGKQAEAFLNGMVATLVATPCTGPFLGSAVGFALSLHWMEAMLVFSMLGLGVAFPYLLLALFPAWLKWLPKPGMWMEVFKGWMGMLLLTAVLWLLWVFAAETHTNALLALLASLLGLGAAAWSYGLVGKLFLRGRAKMIACGLSALCLVGATLILFQSRSSGWVDAPKEESSLAMSLDEIMAAREDWLPFSAERLAALQERGVPVMVDFTAKWCLICQSNHLVLSSASVTEKIRSLGVVKMQADWTKKDPAITKALSLFGRSSVPLYVLYGKDPAQPPQILPQVLTPEVVSQYLDNMR